MRAPGHFFDARRISPRLANARHGRCKIVQMVFMHTVILLGFPPKILDHLRCCLFFFQRVHLRRACSKARLITTFTAQRIRGKGSSRCPRDVLRIRSQTFLELPLDLSDMWLKRVSRFARMKWICIILPAAVLARTQKDVAAVLSGAL